MSRVKNILKYLVAILNREQKVYGTIVLVASVIGAILETLGVSAIAPIILALMNPDELMANSMVQSICVFLQIKDSRQFSIWLICAIITLYVVKNLYFIFFSWIKAKYACKIQRELAVTMMESYMGRGYQFFTEHNTGELLNGVTDDIGSVYQVIATGLKVLVDVLTIILICIYMFMQSISLASCVIVLAVLCLLLILKVFRKAMLRSGNMYRKYNMQLQQTLMHAFHGIKDVLILNKKEFFVKEYNTNYIQRQNESVKRTVANEIPAYIIEGLCISGMLLAVVFEFAFSNNPTALIATLASFAVGAFRILPSLGRISAAMNTILYSLEGIEAVYNNIIEVRILNANNEGVKSEENLSVVFEKGIEISNLDFSYKNSEEKVLSGINMEIKKGQSVAFIGASGSGKTTLADIILGLLEQQNGKVSVDGRDIHEYGSNWNKLIGYVPQSVYLIDSTIRMNVAFGEKESSIDDAKVWKALEQAQLADFVRGLENGIDTYVGDRGIRFSGGQRQRMAIARALYFKPEILVLDEATSALDNDTEKAVMEAIEALQGKITMIIVAHRLSTIKNCDVIYEIEKGKAYRRDKQEILEKQ